jgi:hypothetical protein
MRVLVCVSMVALAMAIVAGPATAFDMVATFDGGGTDAAPVTDVVDAYTGMAGNGWGEGWYKYIRTGTATYTVGTNNATPLGTDTGNYLDLTMTPTVNSGNGRYGSVHRSYAAGINCELSHSIAFKFRVNEDVQNPGPLNAYFTSSTDRYQLFDAPSYSQATANAYCSWVIGCYGGGDTWLDASKRSHWVVFNGDNNDTAFSDDRNLDTGIAVMQNTVYDFHIDIDAVTKTWDVTIGTGGSTLYDSTVLNPSGLGWRTKSATVAGLPHFASYGDGTSDTRAYSIDNLKITGTPFGPPGGIHQVAAHFAGGNSTTVVDAYAGQAGDGWKTAWATAVTRTDVVATVVSPGDTGYAELKSGQGAYLSVTSTQNTADNTGLATVTRDYKTTATPGIDWSAKHTVKFTVRIDENVSTFTEFDDRYLIFDSPTSRSGTSADSAWMVTAYGAEGTYAGADVVGEWSFFNGDRLGGDLDAARNVDTNVDIVTGGVYDFTIVVDPTTQSYDATVSDGTNTFTAMNLGWRTAGDQVGGVLCFGARSSANGEVRAFSLDELTVTEGAPVTISVPGDTDGNGIVDATDAAVLARNWGGSVSGATNGDFNGDGVVNAADAAILAANWGNHNSESAAGVPEPSTMVLLLAGLGWLLIRRRG